MKILLLCIPWKTITLLYLLLSCSWAASQVIDNNGQLQNQWSRLRTARIAGKRVPPLYTEDFGDCMAKSMVKLTQFHAAYYHDDLMVGFHLDGHTSLKNESIMVYIGFFAYGKRRFDLIFDPCEANIRNLCPMDASRQIGDGGLLQVAPTDISGISQTTLRLPDLEGRAVLRVFSNSTRSQIACYASTVTNGVTMSHPQAVVSLLALIIFITFILSLATIIYGEDILTMQLHYSHSSSLLLAFTVLHHIYFTGAISANWPRVLVEFWSNFAPFAGMIYSKSMQSSIDRLVGADKGDVRILGANPVGNVFPHLGGYNITNIYNTSPSNRTFGPLRTSLWAPMDEQDYHASASSASLSSTFQWQGQLVDDGFPMPGNYSGFAGTLSMQKIPAVNALTTGLLWVLVLIAALTAVIPVVKMIIELLIHWKVIKGRQAQNLAYFRIHWPEFVLAMLLRSLFIGFGMLSFLALFQFGFGGAASVKALAAITFLVLILGSVSITAYAISYRHSHFTSMPERRPLVFERRNLLNIIPWFVLTTKGSTVSKESSTTALQNYPWWKSCVHDTGSNESKFLLRFGWLLARFKDDRWHFCVIWLMHEFLRACFLGGAVANPISQTVGLLILEITFMICVITMNPFEAKRLSIVLYTLSFSNISSALLSIPLLAQHNLNRMAAFAIGMAIAIIHSILVLLLVISMLSGIITSYISLTRNRRIPADQLGSHPIRMRYLGHVNRGVGYNPGAFYSTPGSMSPTPRQASFKVHSVRRCPKIIDESPTPYHRNPSTPTSSLRVSRRTYAPPFPLDPSTPPTTADAAILGFRDTDSSDPFTTPSTMDLGVSGLKRADSLGQNGTVSERLQGRLCRITSLETVLSRSASRQEHSQGDSLCLTDTFETARSDMEPLTEFITPLEDREEEGASYSNL
ncbi:TRP-like family [Trichophyton rubrum]|nr:TRP-like family [Trichophyton rubrum]